MTPEVISEPVEAVGLNGVVREPPFLARARRVLAGSIQPSDYLFVTPEVQHTVKLAMGGYNERAQGRALAPEVERRQLNVELLSFHHGDQPIVYVEDERGIVVLAVGGDQAQSVLATFGPDHATSLFFDIPMSWMNRPDVHLQFDGAYSRDSPAGHILFEIE